MVLISHKHQFIYLKTHKTASTSVEGLLEYFCVPEGHETNHKQLEIKSDVGYVSGRAGGREKTDYLKAHASANAIRGKLGRAVFETYTKTYMVRHPYDKVVSWFWHVMPDPTKARLEGDFEAARTLFNDWIQMRPNLNTDRQFYSTDDGVFPAIRIRYEHMAEDLEALGRELNIDLDASKLPSWKSETRQHKAASYHEYYTRKAKKIVDSAFKFDFKNFGYENTL